MRHRKIGNVMTSDVVRAVYATPFKDVALLLAHHDISGLPVVDEDDKVIGVVTETDLMFRQAKRDNVGCQRLIGLTRGAHRAAAKARARTAGELMSTPPVTAHAEDSIAFAARTMAQHRVERLPVLDEENRLVGIVSRRDVLQVFLRPDSDIRREVIDEILVRTLWRSPQTIGVKVTDGVVTLEGRLERQSEVTIAVQLINRIDGVVGVVNHLTFRLDDSHLRPLESGVHGVTDELLRKG
ncbi:CBS domain-containing protein [Streptomyces sp. H39-S7]|uniref:CBS domain-containing protein n=1 Tax=Streptomyces sp. H39-S7 TaxID=3004357 RepID=UPI0022AE8B30|nr:CBS domain-containing protein [Streptomyces sp. H39-S7]MCZ4122753.1 CBS domain-containing protein [Streptomyces sp. H39-S7]